MHWLQGMDPEPLQNTLKCFDDSSLRAFFSVPGEPPPTAIAGLHGNPSGAAAPVAQQGNVPTLHNKPGFHENMPALRLAQARLPYAYGGANILSALDLVDPAYLQGHQYAMHGNACGTG